MEKFKLIGNVEVLTDDLNKIKAEELLYYLKENKFEGTSDVKQIVSNKFFFNKNNILNQSSTK